MKKQEITHIAQQKWQRYNAHEKGMIIYCLLLLLFFLLFPLIRVDSLSSTQVETYGIFSAAMTKTWLLMLILVGFLMVWNGSYRFKLGFHRIFGYNGSDTMTNVFMLFSLLVMVFAIGDTTGLLKQNFSTRISSTSRFLIIGLYLVGGLAWQLVITRLERKKQGGHATVTIKQEVDTSKKERSFHKVEQEFKGLFGKEDRIQEEI